MFFALFLLCQFCSLCGLFADFILLLLMLEVHLHYACDCAFFLVLFWFVFLFFSTKWCSYFLLLLFCSFLLWHFYRLRDLFDIAVWFVLCLVFMGIIVWVCASPLLFLTLFSFFFNAKYRWLLFLLVPPPTPNHVYSRPSVPHRAYFHTPPHHLTYSHPPHPSAYIPAYSYTFSGG